MLLTELLGENIEKFGEYNLLYYNEKTYTNKETEIICKKVSSLVHSLGVGKGDRVLICMPNSPEVIFSYQGVLGVGGIIVPVMYLLHENEINFILKNSEAKVVITSSVLLEKINGATKGLDVKPKVISIDQPNETVLPDGLEVIVWDEALSNMPLFDNSSLKMEESDVAVILYTSGTTGAPKGVMLTHKNLYANSMSGVALREEDETSATTIGVLPLAHIYGFGIMNGMLLLGNSVVIFSKFEAEEIFKVIEKYKVKSFAAVPAMVHAMLYDTSAENYDLSSLETVGSGSAALAISLRQKFKEKFGAEVRDAYGLSEASPGVASQRNNMPIKEGSVGIPMPGVAIKIVNEQGHEVPVGEVGELLVQGDNVTPGYYKNEEATKKALVNGWLHTGDMAKVDEDGYLYIVDRKKDLIIRGGFNVYPRDLEELLVKHEAVLEAAVIGIPSERMGEEILACIVKKPEANVIEQELIQYCQKNLAKYKTPRHVEFIDELPRNGVGKILKTKLRERFASLTLD
ncbi:class I adenylate-forming enzyme family protein [Lysinibacillus sp. SGAir0095]|uniref:class I adenylate-forming enzyme family protein n=1 Tax=Lysinibacillus sp. SGAir0095 TaxID=2070463 RepID=UPI0010CCEBB6|nr:long-chain-fatty-acid--CoA ligase [Lysinibacillus sp. SGAir0095]QCR32682.1 long-chain fatty acid--CoA ligase [Lysinibacillus sp. SGAir0095]